MVPMAADSYTLSRLCEQKQNFFLPYYIEIVARHPAGIGAAEVKGLLARQLLDEFGIDISDPIQTGLNPSTNGSRADQWANNLISNRVLDEHMLVVRGPGRGTRAMLYPGVADNSRAIPPPGPALTRSEVPELDARQPRQIQTQGGGQTFQRSLQLAEYVRELNHRACAVGKASCAVFNARDGRPYVEVHHVVPMAMQGRSTINLDRSTNMVPVCPRCHACLHRGQRDQAADVLNSLFQWFESIYTVPFQQANDDLAFDTTLDGLLEMYGIDIL